MEVSLLKWERALRSDLVRICNQVDRRYLSEEQLRMTGGSPETIPYWNLY